jgi:hypothetical protein
MEVYYKPHMYHNLKAKFPGAELLQCNYSNLCQDMFVLSILNGKRQGTFIEIGGELPIQGNNTVLLEKQFGWRGYSIELNPRYADMWAADRTSPLYIQSALDTDYTALALDNSLGPIVDYLSVDIEPEEHTLAALQKIDHSQLRFRVITFEHNHYNGGQGPRVRLDSRQYLSSLGYMMIVGDASHAGNLSEDWWIAPELFDSNTIDLFKMQSTYNADEAVYIRGMLQRFKLDQGTLQLL